MSRHCDLYPDRGDTGSPSLDLTLGDFFRKNKSPQPKGTTLAYFARNARSAPNQVQIWSLGVMIERLLSIN
jgi:hypothetical protein